MSLQHILKNSSISGKEPLASQLANGELSINYHADGPFLCCKDTAGNVRRVAGVWVATTAPSTPFPGELWLDTSITPSQLRVYKDTTDHWVYAGEVNPASTAYAGIVQLATNGETQIGTNVTSAVTPASLQSKISDSTTTVSSTTIASSTAVKSVADTVSLALPKSGGIITGVLEIGNTGQLRFEGSSNDGFETTLAVEDPTGTRTITLPNRTGTVITTGDTGTVTSTMIADGAIVNADINASAAIEDTKLATISTAGKVSNSATTATSANTASAIVARDGSGNFSAGTITANLTGNVTGNLTGIASAIADNTVTSAKIVDGTITNDDINANAEIAVSKLADGISRQLLQTDAAGTGVEWTSDVDIPGTLDVTGAMTLDSTLSVPLGSAAAPSIYPGADTNTGIYSPGADQLAISTGGTGRLFVDSSGNVGIGSSSPVSVLDVRFPTNPPTVNGNGDHAIRSFVTASLAADIGGAISLGGTTNNSGAVAAFGQIAGRRENATPDNYAGYLQFATNNGGGTMSERMRIDSSGRLLVGTSSARANFRVGSTNYTGTVQHETGGQPFFTVVSGNADGGGPYLVLGHQRSGSVGGNTLVANDDELGVISFQGSDGTNLLPGARIEAKVDGTPGANDMPGRLVFSTTADGSATPTERMRINSSGNVMIGTSTPGRKLSVNTGNGDGILIRGGGYRTFYSNATLYLSGGTFDNGTGAGFAIASEQVSNGNHVLKFCQATANADATNYAISAERMRIDSNGVQTHNFESAPITKVIYNWSNNTTGMSFRSNNTERGNIYFFDTGVQFNTTSDYRLKENIIPLQNAINRVKLLKPSRFNFIIAPDKIQDGFLAHEVQSVVPEAITGEKDAEDQNGKPLYQSIDHSRLVPLLTAALQEAINKIETLEAKVAALEVA